MIEVYKNEESIFEIEKEESFLNNLSEKEQIGSYLSFGRMCYYGLPNLIESNKEKSLIIFKKGYKLAKEKEYIYLKRMLYFYMYKARKYLFKNNKITLRKLNKTKEKLFRIYEETEECNLNPIELYNYYKLYKFGVIGYTLPKMLGILKSGKKKKIIYHFVEFVYKEKSRLALENEYSTYNLNQYNLILKNELMENKHNIKLIFRTTEGGNQYEISVPLTAQFIKVIHILFNKYPELESKKIGTYIFNANKIKLFDTVSENELKNGSIILIVHMNSTNNKSNENLKKDNTNTLNQNNISVHFSQNEEIANNENAVEERQEQNNENNNNEIGENQNDINVEEEREEQNNYENNNNEQEGGEFNNNNNEYEDDNGEEQENNNFEENQNNNEDDNNEENENINNSENNFSNNENDDNNTEYEEVEEEVEIV